MASSQSVNLVVRPGGGALTEQAAAVLAALLLSAEVRAQVRDRLTIQIADDSRGAFETAPDVWWRFDLDGLQYLAHGVWRADQSLAVQLDVWAEGPAEPDLQLAGGGWPQAVSAHPELAAELLACLYTVALNGSTLALALDSTTEETDILELAAFARAALPPPVRKRCDWIAPFGDPKTLVSGLHANVVAYPTRPGRELGEAYNLAAATGGILFSLEEGQSGGPKPDAGFRAYADAAVSAAEQGSETLLRFARKAGLCPDELLSQPAKLPIQDLLLLTESAAEPAKLDALLDAWRTSGDPDEQAGLLEDDDWGRASRASLLPLAAEVEKPLGGSRLQDGAMRELARRAGERGSAAELLAGDPSQPQAVQHAARLLQTGLLPAELPAAWHAPVSAALSESGLAAALGSALAQGAEARELSLALLDRSRRAPHSSIATTLLEAKQAGRLSSIELAVKAEQAYTAAAEAELGLLEGLVQQSGWSLSDEQRRQVVQAALSRRERAVGPRLLFQRNRLRPPAEWLEEIVDCLSRLPAPDRADLAAEEWASLWAAACPHPELAERLAPLLDGRFAVAPEKLTKALVNEQAWGEWKAASQAPAAVRRAAAMAWLTARGPRAPYLEEWKSAVGELRRLDADDLQRLASAADRSGGLFAPIPLFEPEQTADLIRLAPDDATRELWAQLLERFPATDPYRRLEESAAGYVLGASADDHDEAAAGRRRALELSAAGDWRAAAEQWPALQQLDDSGRLAAAAVGALRQGNLDAPCWPELASLPAGEAVAALLEFVRRRLTLTETTGLAGPLLKLLAQRPNWLESDEAGVPALELLATMESRVGIVVPAMQIARLAAAHGYSERRDWWARLATQTRACPRHDGRPNPRENWEHTRAYLYDRAAGLPGAASKSFRDALDRLANVPELGELWPAATLR